MLQTKVVVVVQYQAMVVVEEDLLLGVGVVVEEVVGMALHLVVEVVEVALEMQIQVPGLEVAGFLIPVL